MNIIEDVFIIGVLVIWVFFLLEYFYSIDYIFLKMVYIFMSNFYYSLMSIGLKYFYWRVEEVVC